LKSLQKLDPLLKNFSETLFRSSVMFPYLVLEKQGRSWVITIAIGEELYFNHSPFFFPNCFLNYQGKYDLQVKLKLIQVISKVSLEKRFCIEDF